MSALSDIVYLSIADPALEVFVDKDAFDRSLLLNILFQPKVLLPDSFIFSSKSVEQHILPKQSLYSKQSLFEAGVATGIVVPAFRERTSSSFMEGFEVIHRSSIRGILESSERIARRLQIAADSNPRFSPVYWPQYNVGVKFAELVERSLMLSEPPPTNMTNAERLRAIWNLTRKWRTESIQEALEATRKLAGEGLRKGEIWGAVARDLGITDILSINQPADLLKANFNSADEKEALQVFCRWVCALYHYNQAVGFAAISSFPSFDPISGAITAYLLPKENVASATSVLQNKYELSNLTIQETVSLPLLKAFQKVSPAELLRGRNEYGPAYFTALSLWQNQPTAKNEMEVRSTIKQYSKELTKVVYKGQDSSQVALEVVLGAVSTPTRAVLATAMALVLGVASISSPWITPLVALGPMGYAVYLWTTGRETDYSIEIKAQTPAIKMLTEVNIPEANATAGPEI